MDIERAQNVTFHPNDVRGDDSTTTGIRILDLSELFEEKEREIYVRAVCTAQVYLLPVAAETEAASLTTSQMDLNPANYVDHFVMKKDFPGLAYSADGGVLRVRRSSERRAI